MECRRRNVWSVVFHSGEVMEKLEVIGEDERSWDMVEPRNTVDPNTGEQGLFHETAEFKGSVAKVIAGK